MVNEMRARNPEAEFMIHPECGCVSSTLDYVASGAISADHTHILSTEGMINHARSSSATQFIVATEIGVLHRMQKANPEKTFLPVHESISCRYMKMTTLDKVLHSLQTMTHRVTVPTEIADKARLSIERMIAL